MKAAVLLIAWRRPHTTQQVIDAIRAYAPERMYVACDGPIPDRPEETEKVLATRAVIEREINWPCQVISRYNETNSGCCMGVSQAITWFFDHEEEGIVLEDDCVPHPDFFTYCESLLEYFRHDERIWCISGSNFQDGQWRGDGTYYFSQYPHCWGWASWRRCWRHYDPALTRWPNLIESNLLFSIVDDPRERSYWAELWWKIYLNPKDATTWDYQWTFLCMANSGLTALPNRNLVSNIGFGIDATHTTNEYAPVHARYGMDVLQHPTLTLRDGEADRYAFENYIAAHKMLGRSSFRSRMICPILGRLHRAVQKPLRSFAKLRLIA